MYEITYELTGIDTKTFYGVNNQYFNLLKSSFPTLKITGRDNFIFAMGNQETLDVLKQKLDDIVSYISTNNSIGLKDLENILKIKSEEEKQLVFDQDIIVKGVNGKVIKAKTTNLKKLVKESEKKDMVFAIGPAGTGAYTNSQGIGKFRDDVAHFITARDEHVALPSNIFLSNGASAAIENVLTGLIGSNRDAIMIPIPQYPIYSAIISRLGARQVGYFLGKDGLWLM